jgi:hypothetical protein
MRLFLCGLIVSVVVAGGAPTGNITVCDLKPRAFEGRLISVKGRLLFTMHGAYLLGDSCASRGQHSAALAYPGDQGAPSVRFRLDPTALSQLRPFFRTTGGQAIACGAFSGEVFYKVGFHLRKFGDIAVGNGFGENGALQATFVLQSVVDIHPCDESNSKW